MDMFEVRKPGRLFSKYGDILETCYYTKVIAENGICQTFKRKPYNWGFCSRSCKFANLKPHQVAGEPYEETMLIIKDRAPRESQLEKGTNKRFLQTTVI